MDTMNTRDRLKVPVRRAGFSLIEMMMVVAILAIVSAIGYPTFQELLASQRVRAASSAVVESMVAARGEALKANASATLVSTDLASGWTVQVGGNVVHTQPPLPGVNFDPVTPTIEYNATGRLTPTSSKAIKISANGTSARRCVALGISGRPAARDPDRDVVIPECK